MFFGRLKSVPHPELQPLSEEECAYLASDRDPMLSLRDYSSQEIQQAAAKGKMHKDMAEYCHNNRISWQAVAKR